MIGIVDDMPLKFADDFAVKAVATKLTHWPFSDWPSCVPQTITVSTQVRATVRCIDDVSVCNEVSVT